MKKIGLLIYFLFLFINLFSQHTWYSFCDEKTDLCGFKDENGVIKIPPKFIGLLAVASKFDNVVAVTEELKDDNWVSYHFNKSGKAFGRDSMFIFDNGFDCEHEGFIRFHDPKTDMMGLFDRNGAIAVTAEYNALSKVMNGLVVGLKNAEKKYWDEHNHSGCNHYSWVGGQQVLIDPTNNLLIEVFSLKDFSNLNLYSLVISSDKSNDPIRESFQSVDGNYYSFINFEKEFDYWVKETFPPEFDRETLIQNSIDSIIWDSPEDWITENKFDFINRNFEVIKSKLLELNKPQADFFYSKDALNPYICEGNGYEEYFDNCGNGKDWIYPVMNIVINNPDIPGSPQDHIDFLRTENGYRLLSVTIRSERLK